MAVHTFGDHPNRFHLHLHAIVSDRLLAPSGAFYVMLRTDLKPFEEGFRARALSMLREEGKISDELIAIAVGASRQVTFAVDALTPRSSAAGAIGLFL